MGLGPGPAVLAQSPDSAPSTRPARGLVPSCEIRLTGRGSLAAVERVREAGHVGRGRAPGMRAASWCGAAAGALVVRRGQAGGTCSWTVAQKRPEEPRQWRTGAPGTGGPKPLHFLSVPQQQR